MSDFCYATQYAPYVSSLGNMSQPYLANISIHNQRENENNNENCSTSDSVVSKTIPRAENFRMIDFAELTGNNSFIRVGSHPCGLIVTPANDFISLVTGQGNNLAGQMWSNVSLVQKNEIQKDILGYIVNGILYYLFSMYRCCF